MYRTAVLGKALVCALLALTFGCRPAASEPPAQRFGAGGFAAYGAGAPGTEPSSGASTIADGVGLDPDALPEGAAVRLGSRRFVSHHGVGFAADGSIVTTTFENDVVTFSRDGRMRIVAANARAQVARGDRVPVAGGTIRVVALDGTEVSAFEPEGCNSYFAEFSLDGRTVICNDSGISVWDVDSGALRFRLDRPDLHTLPESMAASGSTLVFRTSEGRIEVYDLESGAASTLDIDGYPDSIAISHDGGMLYVAVGGRIEARELKTGKVQWEARPHDGTALSSPMVASPDGSMLAVHVRAGESRELAIVDARTRDIRGLGPSEATSLAFSADGSELASVTMGGVSVYDVDSGARVLAPERAYDPIVRARVQGERVATISERGTVTLWDRGSGSRTLEQPVPAGWQARAFTDLALVGGGSVVVLHRSEGAMVLDATTGDRRCTAAAPGDTMLALPDGRSFAVFAGYGPIRIVGVDCVVRKEFGKPVAVLSAELVDDALRVWVTPSNDPGKSRRYWAEDIQMEPWAKKRVSATKGRTLAVPGIEWGKLGAPNDDRRLEKLTAPDARRFALSGLQGFMVGPSGNDAVFIAHVEIGDDRRVGRVIDLETGSVRKTFVVPERVSLDKATFSPNGRWLTLVEDNSVLLYDLFDG